MPNETNNLPHEDQRPEHLRTSAPEKPALQNTVSLEPSEAHDSSIESCPKIDSLDSLLAESDASDEQDPPIEEELTTIGEPRKIPDEHLQTDRKVGLSEREVSQRRKVYGSNQMKEEDRSHVKQFLLFFVGPIQFVMEVN